MRFGKKGGPKLNVLGVGAVLLLLELAVMIIAHYVGASNKAHYASIAMFFTGVVTLGLA